MDDAFLGAELGGDVPEVDLHGMHQREAQDALERTIQSAFMQSERVIRIIHGRGDGVLGEMVQKQLKEHPNVVNHKRGDGVSYAEIERK